MVSIPTWENDMWNWSALLSFPLMVHPDNVICSQMVSYFSLVRADLKFQCKIVQWNEISLLSLPLAVHPDHVHLFIHRRCVSFHWFLHVWHSTKEKYLCEIKVVCSPFYLRYILTMWIHLLSGGKLLSLLRAGLEFQCKNDLWNSIGLLSFPLVVHLDHVNSFILRR